MTSSVKIHVVQDVEWGNNPQQVIEGLAGEVSRRGWCSDVQILVRDALARESKQPTGVKGRVAIPHCRTESVSEPLLVCARLSQGCDFSGPDGDATIVFLLAAPLGADKAHMKILSTLARALVRTSLADDLRASSSSEHAQSLIVEALNKPKKSADRSAKALDTGQTGNNAQSDGTEPIESPDAQDAEAELKPAAVRLIAVTSCPTGIAHTYMAADALEVAASSRDDVDLHIETQGAQDTGSLPTHIVNQAQAVIIASDIPTREEERFAGKPIVRVPARTAINEANSVLDRAVDAAQMGDEAPSHEKTGFLSSLSAALLSALQQCLGLILVSGVLVGIGRFLNPDLFASFTAAPVRHVGEFIAANHAGGAPIGSWLLALGIVGFTVAPCVAAGLVARHVGAPTAFGPGVVSGLAAVLWAQGGSGVIGALLAGIVAGAVVRGASRVSVPPSATVLKDIVVAPVLACAVAIMASAWVIVSVAQWLTSAWFAIPVVVVAILAGAMIAWDLGGPVNKIAFGVAVFGLCTLQSSALIIMAAVLAAGMVPPLAYWLAGKLDGQVFSNAEESTAVSVPLADSQVLWDGLFFRSEAAQPLVAVAPSMMRWIMVAGAVVAAAVTSVCGVGTVLPHGGIAAIVGTIGSGSLWHPLLWILALMAGTSVSAVSSVWALRRLRA